MKVREFHFFRHDLLRRDFAVGVKEMINEDMNVGGIAPISSIQHCSKVNWINDLNNLSNEG